MQYREIKTLKQMVEYCLSNFEDTRNSDIKLTNKIWIEFYPEYIKKENNRYSVDLLDLYLLPKEDNVKRVRANFNAKGKYLPNDPEVRKQRQINEEQWRLSLGYNPELRTVGASL